MTVTSPSGFVAGAVDAGIRRSSVPDLAVVHSTRAATGTAMFTTNSVQAAPITVSKAHLSVSQPQAVVINSGVANAATGERGELDALATAAEASRLLGLPVEQVLVLSTGLIGAPLPVAKVRRGLRELIPDLSADGGEMAAQAIMTTDTAPKSASLATNSFCVGGMAKGSGMIHPSLATMLAIVTTDYPLEPGEAIEFLRPAVAESFNRISVDGDCSTNDAVILLANGRSGGPRDDESFAHALGEVCHRLARQIVEDGEGASILVEISVLGAASTEDADAVGRQIAGSSLVKTAAFGRDPNWGRVIAAAGAARSSSGNARVDAAHMTISFNGTKVFTHGRPTNAQPDMTPNTLMIDVDLGIGNGESQFLTSDLSYEYVRINAEYTT